MKIFSKFAALTHPYVIISHGSFIISLRRPPVPHPHLRRPPTTSTWTLRRCSAQTVNEWNMVDKSVLNMAECDTKIQITNRQTFLMLLKRHGCWNLLFSLFITHQCIWHTTPSNTLCRSWTILACNRCRGVVLPGWYVCMYLMQCNVT